MIAKSAPIISAKRTVIFARPASGETQTTPSPVSPRSRKWRANSGSAVMWSTGIVKKPWIWPACRSIVSTRSAPASCSRSATKRAEIGSRGFALRSCRAYGNSGTTAVIRFADASFAAWIMKASSMMLRSIGGQPVWTRNRSAPRIDSSYRTYVSPFANVSSSIAPSSTPMCSAIRCASSGCERPDTTISRLPAVRSMKWPPCGWVLTCTSSRPGSRMSSVVAIGSIDIPLLVHLPRAGNPQRARRHVLGDQRSGGDPSVVPHGHGRDEAIVDAGPDVAPDRRPPLRPAGLVREVGRDRACADVRALADVRVADVREMGHLRARADVRVLDLHEGAGLGLGAQDRGRAKVTERPHGTRLADLGVDDHDVRVDLGAGSDGRDAPQHGERVDHDVRLDRDVRLDPRRLRVDDRDAREHVGAVDAV